MRKGRPGGGTVPAVSFRTEPSVLKIPNFPPKSPHHRSLMGDSDQLLALMETGRAPIRSSSSGIRIHTIGEKKNNVFLVGLQLPGFCSYSLVSPACGGGTSKWGEKKTHLTSTPGCSGGLGSPTLKLLNHERSRSQSAFQIKEQLQSSPLPWISGAPLSHTF